VLLIAANGFHLSLNSLEVLCPSLSFFSVTGLITRNRSAEEIQPSFSVQFLSLIKTSKFGCIVLYRAHMDAITFSF
jgi:hypothetical protein